MKPSAAATVIKSHVPFFTKIGLSLVFIVFLVAIAVQAHSDVAAAVRAAVILLILFGIPIAIVLPLAMRKPVAIEGNTFFAKQRGQWISIDMNKLVGVYVKRAVTGGRFIHPLNTITFIGPADFIQPQVGQKLNQPEQLGLGQRDDLQYFVLNTNVYNQTELGNALSPKLVNNANITLNDEAKRYFGAVKE